MTSGFYKLLKKQLTHMLLKAGIKEVKNKTKCKSLKYYADIRRRDPCR